MKRLFVALALALAASTVFAQTEPRGPVILSSGRGEGGGGADPTGVYEGTVILTKGDATEISQTWRLALKAQSCPSCPAGQYVVSETDYSMVRLPTGTERGSVWGVLNRDGTLSLELRGVNCNYLTLGLGGESFYQSGSLGPSPGAAMRLVDGTISGRISGYDCFGENVYADVQLTKEPEEEPIACHHVAAVYSGEFENDCGGVVQADTIPTQSGCALTVYAPDAKAAFSIVMTSQTAGTLAVNFTDGCSGSGRGSAEIADGRITATYTGTIEGGADCCPPGPISGTFRLSQQ